MQNKMRLINAIIYIGELRVLYCQKSSIGPKKCVNIPQNGC